MFRLKAVQAQFGDCLLLEYGDKRDVHHILIDGGPPKTYENHLRGVLEGLSATGAKLDLVILSHIDNDHVVGLVEFFSELLDQKTNGKAWLIDFGGAWLNSFAQTLDQNGLISAGLASLRSASGLKSLAQTSNAILGVPEGDKLRKLTLQLGKPLNQGFPDGLILVDTATPETMNGLTMQIVGPTRANLEALRQEWEEYLKKVEDAVASNDMQTLANVDKSVPNLSSVMVLAGYGGKTILLTGDGRSDHLLDGLKMAGKLDTNGCLHVDVIKLAHHGSDRDTNKRFFEKITADIYVVSADGRYGNPDSATLEWLVQAAHSQNRKFVLIATNDTPSLKQWRKKYPSKKYGYELRLMAAGDHFVEVDL